MEEWNGLPASMQETVTSQAQRWEIAAHQRLFTCAAKYANLCVPCHLVHKLTFTFPPPIAFISSPLKASPASILSSFFSFFFSFFFKSVPSSSHHYSLWTEGEVQIRSELEMKIIKWCQKGTPDKSGWWWEGEGGVGTRAWEDNDSLNRLQVETTSPNNLGCVLIRKSEKLTSTSVQKHWRNTASNYSIYPFGLLSESSLLFLL